MTLACTASLSFIQFNKSGGWGSDHTIQSEDQGCFLLTQLQCENIDACRLRTSQCNCMLLFPVIFSVISLTTKESFVKVQVAPPDTLDFHKECDGPMRLHKLLKRIFISKASKNKQFYLDGSPCFVFDSAVWCGELKVRHKLLSLTFPELRRQPNNCNT